jgi:hypothetical protein
MRALHDVRASATSMAVAEWVRNAGADFLDTRKKSLAANEESWRRTSMYTPSSGMQRVTTNSVMTTLPDDGANAIPGGMPSSIPAAAPNSLPGGLTTGTMMSSPPPLESGAFRLALGVSPLATFGAKVRRSRFLAPRYLPWISAGLFIVAGLVGGLVRGAPDAATPASASAPSEALTLPVLPMAPPVAPAGVLDPASASPVAPASPPVTPTPTLSAASSPPPQPAVQWRSFHAPPPPSPPRVVLQARSSPQPATASSPSAPSASTTASAKGDCNPPFFYEGTKKVFKPSCL